MSPTPNLCLDVRCAACGQPLPHRTSPEHVRALRLLPPEILIDTFVCQTPVGPNGGRCGEVIPVHARAWQRAVAVPSRPVRPRPETFTEIVGPRSARTVRSRGIQP